ncbi:response regulator [Shewanella sp. GXUN23E]|uniref:response regulator n=1 Tax=Shewanella sp. GXUN23E TaxID=3422498 RepID=UPI003D7C63E7
MESKAKSSVLIVDDAPENLQLLNGLLKDIYQVKAANHGQKALEIVEKTPVDIILLDVVMPGMDGYEVCRRLKADKRYRDIPVIFLTAKDSSQDEQYGFDLGASDYIAKPVSPPVVLARVRTHLQVKASQDFLKDQNAYLEAEVRKRMQQVSEVQDVTISALASLAETRDEETGYHIRRTQWYVKLLAEKVQDHPRFRDELTPEKIDAFFKSAPLHDVGKVGIADSILLKPGRLTPEEFEVMKQHAYLGYRALDMAEKEIGAEDSFLTAAKDIAYYHHEKWDGSGYPTGKQGEEIPLSARLMAIADVYDALISKRVYKDAMSHDQALDIIREGRGTHFDPDLIDAFFEIEDQFAEIAEKYKD